MENQVNRGRGRGRGTRRNFFSSSVERTEAGKAQAKEQQIEFKSQPSNKFVDEQKKEGLIEKGKSWLNKHFGGMQKADRGNIKVTLNERFDFELYAMYEQKLANMISNITIHNDVAKERATHMLKPLISTLIGIKLLKSSTQSDQAVMLGYKGIGGIDVRAPERMTNIIDSFGKSDAINDNVIRITASNLYAKAMFFNAIMDFNGIDKTYEDHNFTFNNKVKFQDIKRYRDDHIVKESTIHMYEPTVDGVKYVNSFGLEGIEYINTHDFRISGSDDSDSIYARLPYFDPKDRNNIDAILTWESKVRKFFTLVKYDYKAYTDTMSLVLLGWLPLKFLRDKKSKFAKLDSRFSDTVFAAVTPEQMLTAFNLYSINDWMNDDMLTNNIVYLLELYKTRYQQIYEQVFNMKVFRPTEFGTSAQVVEDHSQTRRYLDSDNYSSSVPIVANLTRCTSHIKMKDDEALIGSIFKFNRRVEYNSNYYINLVSKTNEIRLDYIMKDFK